MIIKVTVSGPGGCINYEAETIKRALEAAGCFVDYENSHPDQRVVEEHRSTRDDDFNPLLVAPKRIKSYVKLIVEHCPWGG